MFGCLGAETNPWSWLRCCLASVSPREPWHSSSGCGMPRTTHLRNRIRALTLHRFASVTRIPITIRHNCIKECVASGFSHGRFAPVHSVHRASTPDPQRLGTPLHLPRALAMLAQRSCGQSHMNCTGLATRLAARLSLNRQFVNNNPRQDTVSVSSTGDRKSRAPASDRSSH